MCWILGFLVLFVRLVSVAGCLGYDVLVFFAPVGIYLQVVSVAGCLGYDVLVYRLSSRLFAPVFQLLVV